MGAERVNLPSPPSEPWVVALGSAVDAGIGGIGAKAANLGRMIRAGLPVPPGFCVTAAAFREWIRSCAGAGPLLGKLDGLPHVEVATVRQIAEELRRVLSVSPLAAPAEEAIVVAGEHDGSVTSWAVRSSATCEDLSQASFAGQHDTILDVRGRDGLLEAVRRCWLSLFSDRAVLYRRKHRLPHGRVSMAVVVQEMIRADISGVAFTADPRSGRNDRLMIECVPGPGQGVVQGTVRPWQFLIEKASARVVGRCSSGEPECLGPGGPPVGLAPVLWPAAGEPNSNGGDRSAGGEQEDSGPGLPRAMIEALLALTQRSEELFGGPQDIEWATHNGRLWLLQSRPITTLPRVEEAGTSVWSNMNVAENLPNVATPMTWSFLDTCFRRIGDVLFRGFGIDPERQPALALVAGRVYMNVTTVRQILSAFPGLRNVPTAWLFGGYQDDVAGLDLAKSPADGLVPPTHPRARLRPGLLLKLIWQRTSWRGRRRYLAHLDRTVSRFMEVDARDLSDAEWIHHFRRILDYGLVQLRVPLMLGPGLAFPIALRRFTRRWLDDADGALAARLISGAGGMASAEAPLELWRLAIWISGQEQLHQAVLEAPSFAALSDRLNGGAGAREFWQRWEAFLAQHGHRTRGEVDIALPRWSERREEVLGLLRHYLRSLGQMDPPGVLAERSCERARLWIESRTRLRNPLRRWTLGFLVRQAQVGLVFRENLKNELVRVIAYLRGLLLEMGGRLTRSGVVDRPEDIFFLTLQEIEPVVTGAAEFNARSVVQARRGEYEANEALSPPPVVVGSFNPALHRPPPADPGTTVLAGLAVSAGVAVGLARVILQADTEATVLPGEILVAPHTDPGWTPHFLTAAGLVTDLGGQLSHGSVVAREYGLPAVVNVQFATRLIRTGQKICVDGDRGRVMILDSG